MIIYQHGTIKNYRYVGDISVSPKKILGKHMYKPRIVLNLKGIQKFIRKSYLLNIE